MDHSAQARIDSLIRGAHSNSYTLYILVHDHAHWDINRCVCVRERKKMRASLEVMQNDYYVHLLLFHLHNNRVQ